MVIKNLLLVICRDSSDSWPSWSTDMTVMFDLLFGPLRAAFPAGAQDFKMAALTVGGGTYYSPHAA